MVVEMLQITAEQAQRQLFVALELARKFAQSQLTSTARFARQKTGELPMSLVRARSGQIPCKLSPSKDIENGPWDLVHYTDVI